MQPQNLSIQRRLYILELVRKKFEVSVEYLSQVCNVSAVTIRSDLNYLEQNGYIDRVHGGAVLKQKTNRDMDKIKYTFTNFSFTEKLQLVNSLSQLINEQSSIYINDYSTFKEILPFLLLRTDILVITKNIKLGNLLNNTSNNLFFIGGATKNNLTDYIHQTIFFKDKININIQNGYITKKGMLLLDDLDAVTDEISYMENSEKNVIIVIGQVLSYQQHKKRQLLALNYFDFVVVNINDDITQSFLIQSNYLIWLNCHNIIVYSKSKILEN